MPESPAESSDAGSLSPEAAFALLGNDTRVDILRALWDAFESGRGDNAVPFSELFAEVDIVDSGNFSYHLEKLTGCYVRRTDAGYELTQSGINVVRAVVAGTVTDDSTLGPTAIDVPCPRCDAPIEIEYEDEFLNIACTTCPGSRRWHGEPGHLFGALVPPLGVDQHAIERAFHAAVTYSLYETAIFDDGVCPHCLGSVESAVDACAGHDPGDGLCPNCDRFNLANVWMACTSCKRSIPPSVPVVALHHPAATVFYDEHGLDHRYPTWETVARSFRAREELVSADPLRIRVGIPAGDDQLQLTFDDAMNVLHVGR